MKLREMFGMSILAMEYPGYGMFSYEIRNKKYNLREKEFCTPKKITANGMVVMQHILKPVSEGGLGYQAKDIFMFGRSIGTGPATTFARLFNTAGLICISPYTTIKKVAANVAGGFLSLFMDEHFNNIESIKQVYVPVLLIHGKLDTLVPAAHSEELYAELMKQKDDKTKNSS